MTAEDLIELFKRVQEDPTIPIPDIAQAVLDAAAEANSAVYGYMLELGQWKPQPMYVLEIIHDPCLNCGRPQEQHPVEYPYYCSAYEEP